MTNTHIVRRIDDLGRIVIPKEIRRTMGFKPGDMFEIYTTKDGCVCFKKYYPVDEQQWATANRIASVMLDFPFALLNHDGEVMVHNSQDNDITIDNSKPNYTLYLDDECIGYIQALVDGISKKRLAETGKIIEELFKEKA